VTDRPPSSASPRAALAEVAERVISHMPGVALTSDRAGAWQTTAGDRAIHGVTAVARSDGRYDLGLHVVVAWPPDPLPRLADELRRRVQAAVKRAGLEPLLGPVDIDIVSVEDPNPLAGSDS
jgi:hypothetical protein